MATRNPVSVLPEPVGEATSTSLPAAMWGQAADCGDVGPAGNRRANQLATAGWNSDSGEAAGTPLFHQDVVTPTNAVSQRAGQERRPPAPAGDHRRLGQVELPGGHGGEVLGDLILGGDAVVEQLVPDELDRRHLEVVAGGVG